MLLRVARLVLQGTAHVLGLLRQASDPYALRFGPEILPKAAPWTRPQFLATALGPSC
jgi:hypothetical protein